MLEGRAVVVVVARVVGVPLLDAAVQHLFPHAVVGDISQQAELVADLLLGELLVLLVDLLDDGLPLLLDLLGWDVEVGLLQLAAFVLLPAQAVR